MPALVASNPDVQLQGVIAGTLGSRPLNREVKRFLQLTEEILECEPKATRGSLPEGRGDHSARPVMFPISITGLVVLRPPTILSVPRLLRVFKLIAGTVAHVKVDIRLQDKIAGAAAPPRPRGRPSLLGDPGAGHRKAFRCATSAQKFAGADPAWALADHLQGI